MENLGFRNLLWFIGVVEEFYDEQTGYSGDPLGLFRSKVRCFGFHPFRKDDPNLGDQEAMPTKDLPWAVPIMNNEFYAPPKSGDWVFGFFVDGRDAQHPMLLGILPGINTYLPPNPSDNVDSDKRYIYNPVEYWKPSTPKVARGEDLDKSQVFDQVVMQTQNVESASGKKWDQPPPAYNTRYPNNRVLESRSGHLIEIDDTPGAERVHIFHKNGSKIEMDNAGTTVYKTVGSNYRIIDENEFVNIDGKQDVTVSGNQYVYIKGNCNLKVDGDYTTNVHGNYTLNVAGKVNYNIGENVDIRAAKIALETYAENINIFSNKKLKMLAKTEMTMTANNVFVYSNSEIHQKATGNLFITSDDYVNINGNQVAVEGGRIDLNPDSFSVAKASKGESAIETEIQDEPITRKIVSINDAESIRGISILDIDENFTDSDIA